MLSSKAFSFVPCFHPPIKGFHPKNKRLMSHFWQQANLSIFPYKVASLPRLVTPAKVPDVAAHASGYV
jgi:hypothetical protein